MIHRRRIPKINKSTASFTFSPTPMCRSRRVHALTDSTRHKWNSHIRAKPNLINGANWGVSRTRFCVMLSPTFKMATSRCLRIVMQTAEMLSRHIAVWILSATRARCTKSSAKYGPRYVSAPWRWILFLRSERYRQQYCRRTPRHAQVWPYDVSISTTQDLFIANNTKATPRVGEQYLVSRPTRWVLWLELGGYYFLWLVIFPYQRWLTSNTLDSSDMSSPFIPYYRVAWSDSEWQLFSVVFGCLGSSAFGRNHMRSERCYSRSKKSCAEEGGVPEGLGIETQSTRTRPTWGIALIETCVESWRRLCCLWVGSGS